MTPLRQESNTKPQGITGPFPSFPFCFSTSAEILSSNINSTNAINHEFYILQASLNDFSDELKLSNIWIAPHGYTTPDQMMSNGIPLNRFDTPGTIYSGYVNPNSKFIAGPFPKGHAIYLLLVNEGDQKAHRIHCHGVIALDIYKDENYPTKRH